MDLPARGAADRRQVRRHVPRRRPVAEAGLYSAKARTPCTRTRRGCDSSLAHVGLAADQEKGRDQKASVVLLDENGFILQPLNRRTGAPAGTRPVQYDWHRHDRLSVIGSLRLSSLRKGLGVHFAVQTTNVRAADVMAYLRELYRSLGRPLIVVLDRLGNHRSAVRQLQHASWLSVEWLATYAPDLNPVESLWSYAVFSDLANYVPDDVHDLRNRVIESISDVGFELSLK